ncbi:hypothetical protein Pelo_9119 [Pelomyxa schiedti]|nr:hypothetical protein Pelo_9119 [Pelomyxa schiedti]
MLQQQLEKPVLKLLKKADIVASTATTFTVKNMQQWLIDHNLPKQGRRAELIQRITPYYSLDRRIDFRPFHQPPFIPDTATTTGRIITTASGLHPHDSHYSVPAEPPYQIHHSRPREPGVVARPRRERVHEPPQQHHQPRRRRDAPHALWAPRPAPRVAPARQRKHPPPVVLVERCLQWGPGLWSEAGAGPRASTLDRVLGVTLVEFVCCPAARTAMHLPSPRRLVFQESQSVGLLICLMGDGVATDTPLAPSAPPPAPPPPPQRGPRIEAAIRARDQFLAVATGALVGRCGVGSPVTAAWSRGTIASLWEFGRSWVLFPSTPIGMTLLPNPHYPDLFERVHVSMGVSPTLGVVYCECWENSPTSMSEALCYLAGAVGNNRVVMVCDQRWYLAEPPGAPARRKPRVTTPSLLGPVGECTTRWIVRKTPDSLDLWRVRDGELDEGRAPHSVPARVATEYLHISGDTLVMVVRFRSERRDAMRSLFTASVLFVDLQKTYTSREMCITDQWECTSLASSDFVGAFPVCTLIRGKDEMGLNVHHSTSHISTVMFKDCCRISFTSDNNVCATSRGPPETHHFYNLSDTSKPVFSVAEPLVLADMPRPPRQGVIPVHISPLKTVFVDTNTGSHLAVLYL